MKNNYIISELEQLRLPKVEANLHKMQLRKHLIEAYVKRETARSKIINIVHNIVKSNPFKQSKSFKPYQKPLFLCENNIGFRCDYSTNIKQTIINSDSTT